MDADVAVVGLGTMGAMAAWRLARSGADVIGFEQYGIAHDRGAAGGESRLFRMAYHEGPQYVPLLRRARTLWHELAELSGRPLLTTTGCLSIGPPAIAPMRNVLRSVREHGLEHTVLDGAELAERYPQHAARDGEIGVLDAQGGVLRPELAVLSAAEQARAHGARLLDRTTVTELLVEDGGVRVRTDSGEFTAGRVVVTAGPWTGQLLPELGRRITVRPIVLTWFAPGRGSTAADYAPDRFPAFIRDTGGVHLFGIPVMDGTWVKTGFADAWGDLPDPGSFTRDVDEDRLRPVAEAVAALLPGLHPDPVRHSVYVEGYTRDRTAMVGRVHERAVVLAGFSGHGFKMAPVFGQIAADLALDGGTGFDLAPMAPDRFAAAP
ncbi:N-methyl-L-tryptophan oxidase [Marinitenerispora sediminis]|nr:N-methyl-L-tryptophan oxidase [Marinitenerispora sediminis]